ncbi:MAG: peptidase inhibitor family I36 protein [Nocardioidaceae bacterium]|nr:peptidase inhibitor family I36 protein [Nocardioidaceae bacterium]
MVVLAAAGVGGVQTAEAEFEDCNSGNVCMWGNNDYVWKIGERPKDGGVRSFDADSDRNDEMDSWANRTNLAAAAYSDAGGSGDCQTFHAASRDNNVAPWNSDEVSSWRTDQSC